jgi:hypothetical protein
MGDTVVRSEEHDSVRSEGRERGFEISFRNERKKKRVFEIFKG